MDSQKQIIDILFEVFDATVEYGADSCDNWFPDSNRVDRAWKQLILLLGLNNRLKVENGTMYNVNIANSESLTHTES